MQELWVHIPVAAHHVGVLVGGDVPAQRLEELDVAASDAQAVLHVDGVEGQEPIPARAQVALRQSPLN